MPHIGGRRWQTAVASMPHRRRWWRIQTRSWRGGSTIVALLRTAPVRWAARAVPTASTVLATIIILPPVVTPIVIAPTPSGSIARAVSRVATPGRRRATLLITSTLSAVIVIFTWPCIITVTVALPPGGAARIVPAITPVVPIVVPLVATLAAPVVVATPVVVASRHERPCWQERAVAVATWRARVGRPLLP